MDLDLNPEDGWQEEYWTAFDLFPPTVCQVTQLHVPSSRMELNPIIATGYFLEIPPTLRSHAICSLCFCGS
jgi:hypothetical protein